MTVVNPKSISGITSITTASGSDNLLTIHTSDANNTERFRIDSTGTTKIVTGIVTTLTATGSAKVGTGITLSSDGHSFVAGVSTTGTLSVSGIVTSTGDVDPITGTITSSGDITVGGDLTLESVTPAIKLTDSNQETDNKTFMISGSSTKKLRIQALTDAGGGGGELFEFLRDGNNVYQFQGAKSAVPWFVVNNNTKKVGIGTTIPAKALEVTNNTVPQFQVGMINNSARASLMHNGSHLYFDTTSGDQVFRTGSTSEKLRILSTGGITFNGDTATANALDDYEEGDYLPSFTVASGSITLESSRKTLCYTKIGRKVTIIGQIKVSSVSSPSGILRASLPFTRGNQTEEAERTAGNIVVTGAAVNNANEFTTYPDGGSTSYLEIVSISGTSITRNGGQNMQAGVFIYVNYTYFSAS